MWNTLSTNKLKGVWAKQIALIAGSFLLGLVLTYYFGFIAGLSLNIIGTCRFSILYKEKPAERFKKSRI